MKKIEYLPEIQQILDKMFLGYVEELHGTLKSVSIHENLIALLFDNGVWAVFRASHGDDDEIGIDLERNPRSVETYSLYHLDLLTVDQYVAQTNLESELQRQRESAHEEMIYQKVKARKEQHAK